MNLVHNIRENYHTIFVLLLFSIVVMNCDSDDSPPNFDDDSNIRLKSISSYTSVNPDQVFTYSFIYDTKNRLIRIESNSLGSTESYVYDDNDQLTQVGDYQYFYNEEGDITKIKNDNSITAFGKYDSTMVFYTQGKVTSMVESFTANNEKLTNTTNLSYNNKDQVRIASTVSNIYNFDLEQEFLRRKDKQTYSYDANNNIQNSIRDDNYDSSSFLQIEETYAFDDYKNPIELVLRATGIEENQTVLILTSIAYKNSFFSGGMVNYFKNNMSLYRSIPQSDDDGFVQYQTKTNYTYNKFGYPTQAETTETLLNRDIEYITFTNWEYEEF